MLFTSEQAYTEYAEKEKIKITASNMQFNLLSLLIDFT